MKTDEEIRKAYRIQKVDDSLISLDILTGDDDPEDNTRTTELILEDLSKALPKDTTKSCNLLTDLTPAGKINYASGESKKLFADSPVFSRFSRIALVTSSLVIKTLAISLTVFTGKYENLKIFDTREKAIEWLKHPHQ
jgi:hypothetical protein